MHYPVPTSAMGLIWFRLRTLRQGKRAGEGYRPPFKRRSKQINAEKNSQRDYALAA